MDTALVVGLVIAIIMGICLLYKDDLLYLIGYKYIINTRTKEIHEADSDHANCFLRVMVNKKRIHCTQLKKYLSNGYNGCRYCLKQHDNG